MKYLFVLCFLMCVSCQDEAPGPQGPAGQSGINGEDGLCVPLSNPGLIVQELEKTWYQFLGEEATSENLWFITPGGEESKLPLESLSFLSSDSYLHVQELLSFIDPYGGRVYLIKSVNQALQIQTVLKRNIGLDKEGLQLLFAIDVSESMSTLLMELSRAEEKELTGIEQAMLTYRGLHSEFPFKILYDFNDEAPSLVQSLQFLEFYGGLGEVPSLPLIINEALSLFSWRRDSEKVIVLITDSIDRLTASDIKGLRELQGKGRPPRVVVFYLAE